MALKRVWIPSPNFSSRGGSSVRLIVLHTAEGARTYRDLGSFFQGNVQASSHVGIDDTPNEIGEYVHRPDKAWTCASYNPYSVNAELCAFASWSHDEWMNHQMMLSNCAAWIAEEARYWNIPITNLTDAQAQGSGRGVCQHKQLGAAGGGHSDCGPNFPVEYVLDMARSGVPTPEETEDMAIAAALTAAGTLEVFVEASDGSVWHTWQKKGETAWAGGQAGKQIAGLSKLAPPPGK